MLVVDHVRLQKNLHHQDGRAREPFGRINPARAPAESPRRYPQEESDVPYLLSPSSRYETDAFHLDAPVRPELELVRSERASAEEHHVPARIGKKTRAVLERGICSRVRELHVQNAASRPIRPGDPRSAAPTLGVCGQRSHRISRYARLILRLDQPQHIRTVQEPQEGNRSSSLCSTRRRDEPRYR